MRLVLNGTFFISGGMELYQRICVIEPDTVIDISLFFAISGVFQLHCGKYAKKDIIFITSTNISILA